MFKNRKWLQEGKQSRLTPEIRKLAKQLKGSSSYETTLNILEWIKKNLKFVKSWRWREKYLRKRTAEEVIKSGKFSGCGDKALVFAVLARANRIPVRIVECIDKDWLLDKNPKSINGHVFADAYLNGRWRIIDPAMGNLGISYNWPLGKKFIIYKRGIDSWDIGLKSYKDLEEKFKAFKKRINKKTNKKEKGVAE